jgi:hypothetical protein
VQIRLISKAASCSPCQTPGCNYCGCYCTASNVKLTAAYTVPTGACCTGSSCAITTEAACGGSYKGDSTVCDPNPCGDPVGYCCEGASCSIRSAAVCSSRGGTYGGDGTDCNPNPCETPDPTGSCCTGSICSVTTEAGCSGTWTEDGTCSPSPCPSSTIAQVVG